MTILNQIVARLNFQTTLAVVGLFIAIASLLVSLESSDRDEKIAQETNFSDENAQSTRSKLLDSSKSIERSVRKAAVPILKAFIEHDSKDQKIIDFLTENENSVFRLQLAMNADSYEPSRDLDDSSPPKNNEEHEVSRQEIVSVGCEGMCEGGDGAELIFSNNCETGNCINWEHGFWKIDGYFTIVSMRVEMGGMYAIALKPVAPEDVRLR
jgi:hypothetical protein